MAESHHIVLNLQDFKRLVGWRTCRPHLPLWIERLQGPLMRCGDGTRNGDVAFTSTEAIPG
jgi:hypothetical protein